jgi:hypothetical protein
MTASGRIAVGEGDLAHAGVVCVELPSRFPIEQAAGVDLDRHFGEHERDRLLLGDFLAERLALFRVADGVVERGFRHADGHGGLRNACASQHRHCVRAEARRQRNAAVGKLDFVRFERAHSHVLFALADFQPGRALGHQERADDSGFVARVHDDPR